MQPSGGVTVRRGHSGDLDAVGRLWTQLMEFHAARDPRFRMRAGATDSYVGYLSSNVLPSSDSVLYVAEVDRQPVGFLVARLENSGPIFEESNFAYVSDVVVDEAARREGVGRALVEAARQWGRQRGVSSLRVSVAAENPGAGAFWRSQGFRAFMERLWLDL